MDLYTCTHTTDIHKKLQMDLGISFPWLHTRAHSPGVLLKATVVLWTREEIHPLPLKPFKPVQEAQTSPLPLGIHILAYYFGRRFSFTRGQSGFRI